MPNKMACCRDEELAKKNHFPVLHENYHSQFHRKEIKSNALQQVADDLEFENGEC